MRKKTIQNICWYLLWILPIIIVIISFLIGRYSISWSEFSDAFKGFFQIDAVSNNAQTAIFKIRLPRIVAAFFIGGSLSVAGVIYQTIFQNSLASPDLLGVSSGAGLGACIAILCKLNVEFIQGFAFLGGILAVLLTYIIRSVLLKKRKGMLVYILVGMVVSAMLEAGISTSKYIADPYSDLQSITFWLLGSLSSIQIGDIPLYLGIVMIGLIPAFINQNKLSILSFGTDEAMSLGVNVKRTHIIMIFSATLLTSSSVALGGIIGWIGLVIPHIARFLIGTNPNRLMPSSFLLGGSYLLIMDNVARAVLSMEIPIGILTAAIGAPLFIFFLIHDSIQDRKVTT